MENENFQNIIAERLKELPEELKAYLVSEELSRKMHLVSRKYRFDERQENLFENEVTYVLLVLDSVDNLSPSFQEALGIDSETAEELATDVRDYLLSEIMPYLAPTEADLIIDEEGTDSEKKVKVSMTEEGTQVQIESSAPQSSPVSTSSHLDPQPWENRPLSHEEESLTKADILAQIENPPRTVIKKYVIEHEPIIDPQHLIDDTVDERPKLQDHYND
jgi:hypothetical protein